MLRQRIITGALLVVGLLAALFFFPEFLWTVLVLTILAIAAWEWAGFARLGQSGKLIFALAVLLLALAPIVGKVDVYKGAYCAAALFWILVAPLWLRALSAPIAGWLVLLMGVMVLLPACFAFLQLRAVHPLTLLMFLAVVFIADIAAYFSGRRFGKRKLAPAVSPGKTWAGVYGAFAATLLYGLLWIVLLPQTVPAFLLNTPGGKWLLLPAIALLTAVAVIGDLFESALKRQAGLKDSGNILPGHGGVLDRIDAVLPLLPFAALLVTS